MLSHFSRDWVCAALWTVACQAPLFMGFSRQEYWSGLPCPPPGVVPSPGIEPTSLMSPVLAGEFFTTSASWEASYDVNPPWVFAFATLKSKCLGARNIWWCMLTTKMHHWFDSIPLIRGCMCFAFRNLESFSENKHSLLSLPQLIHELYVAKMKSVRRITFFMENSMLLIFILARIIRC